MVLTAPSLLAQQADFTADFTSGCYPLTVHFTDASSGTITGWNWEFGNGNQSTEKNPAAVFSTAGVYTVKLTVTGTSSTDTETKTGYIVVHDKPTVNFSFDKTEGCAPLTVNFKDASTAGSGNITEWFWVFGDGGSSTQANPTYVYQTTGPKNVSLKVKNQYGCEQTAVKPSAIKVLGPVANFSISSTVFCQVPALAQYTNLSSGDVPLSYSWAFGDGQNSTQKDPSHSFTQTGLFTTTLTVKDKNGCSSVKNQQLRTGSEGGLTVVPSKNKICVGESVSFTKTVETAVLTYNWNFGNGTSSTVESPPPVAYNQAGTFTVVVRAQLVGKSCESIVSFPIEVIAYPVPDFSYSVDCNQKVTFKSTSTGAARVRWELDNGFVSDQATFARSYPGPGSYPVRLIAYNSLGCSETIDRTIEVNGKPVASFLPDKQQDCTGQSLSGCAPFTLNFKNTSTSSSSFTSKWTFGDKTTSTVKDPVHTYAVGTYTVTLDIKNAQGCTATKSATVYVSNVTPVAKFIVSKNSACAREDLSFTDLSTNATFWCWDFGDGSTSSAPSPTHSYEEPGVYTVTLIVKNGGCSSSYSITNAVTVRNPFVDFEIQKDCNAPYSIQLINKSKNYNSLSWSFGDGQTSTGNTSSHAYGATGSYNVVLVGVNTAAQCSVRVEKPVKIYDVEADFTVDNITPCKDAPVTFTDKSQNATRWSWVFGNTAPPDPRQNSSTSYSQAGHYNATLYAYDPDGCFDTKSIGIDVLDITGNFDFTATSDCDDLDVKFTDRSSATPAVSAWSWDFGDNTPVSSSKNPQHTYADVGQYPVTLTVTNANGTCTFIRYNAVNFTVPEPNFKVTKPGRCLNESFQFENISTNATTYAWDFGDGQSSAARNPIIAYDATGSYDVTLKVSDGIGCERSLTRSQYISITKPEARFSATDIYSECPPLTTSFHDESIGAEKWDWSFGDGQHSAYASPPSTYIRPGEFDVTLTVTDVNGCQDTVTKPKLVFVGGPYGTFNIQGAGPFCVNDSTLFTAQTTNAVIHRWDFGDGFVRDQEMANAGHRYKGKGEYHVALVLFDIKGCKVVADGEATVNVMDTSKIDFTYPSCVFSGVPTQLTAESEQADMLYDWVADGTPAGSGQTLGITLDEPGKRTVVLNAVNIAGCVSTIVHEVPVQGDVILVPNVFTPEGLDDLNSTFEITGLERSLWDLTVYNRWGKEVYEQRNYQNDWTAHGLSVGVYYYLLKNSVCPSRQYKGTVSIAR